MLRISRRYSNLVESLVDQVMQRHFQSVLWAWVLKLLLKYWKKNLLSSSARKQTRQMPEDLITDALVLSFIHRENSRLVK